MAQMNPTVGDLGGNAAKIISYVDKGVQHLLPKALDVLHQRIHLGVRQR